MSGGEDEIVQPEPTHRFARRMSTYADRFPGASGRWAAAVVALLIGGALAALLIAAWVAALTVGHGELDRVDSRLASKARSATAAFATRVAAADSSAGSLAAKPNLQRAVLRGNPAAVRRLLAGMPNLALYSCSRLLDGSVAGAA